MSTVMFIVTRGLGKARKSLNLYGFEHTQERIFTARIDVEDSRASRVV